MRLSQVCTLHEVLEPLPPYEREGGPHHAIFRSTTVYPIQYKNPCNIIPIGYKDPIVNIVKTPKVHSVSSPDLLSLSLSKQLSVTGVAGVNSKVLPGPSL